MKKYTPPKGLTLIETILYTIILTIVVSGFLLTLVNILISRERSSAINELADTKQFITQKLGWVLQNVSTINAPAANTVGTSLSINKINFTDNPVIVNLSGSVLNIKEGALATTPLTPTSIVASNMSFNHIVTATDERIVVTIKISNSSTSTAVELTRVIK